MAWLALNTQHLAALLGRETAVHFETLKEGSTRLISRIDHEDVPTSWLLPPASCRPPLRAIAR
jgi:hypothetical protein